MLVVDDEPQILRALAITLRARGYEVGTAGTGAAALEAATRLRPDLLRLALALIILLVALRMALGLAWRPDEIYSIEYL